MSDDEEYSSSEDESASEEFLTSSSKMALSGSKNDGGVSRSGVLTLEDADDDESEFQRPDLAPVYGEDDDDGEGAEEEEERGELSGIDEDEMEGESTPKMKQKAGKNRPPVIVAKSSTGKNGSKLSAVGLRGGLASRDKKSLYVDDDGKKSSTGGKKKRKKPVGICMVATKYECVRRVAKKLAFREVDEAEDWSLFWTDTSVSIDRVNQMKKWQKINHFPGMSEICRKDFLTRNMNRMMKLYPKDYTFYPKAWCLPADYADFINYARQKKNKTYICKPDSGCQGRGIFLTKNPYKDIRPGDNYVAQVYVSRPFTVDGFKFDLRVYVAVTSCDPFRIFVYKEGLARFTTQSYEEPTQMNCKDVFMHLTNYAIQKRSEEFIRDEESGTKRRISTINKWLRENGYDVDKLWADIDDVVIKVLLSAHAVLKHNYRTCFANHFKGSACFEILGYDILVDKKLKPYVLEVNHSPSFTTDSKLDREIKDALIYDTIMLVNIGAGDKRKCMEEERKKVRERLFLKQGKKETKEELDEVLQEWLKHIEKWEDKHMGNFRRIYPAPGCEKYDKFYNTTGTLFSETAASRARIEQAKQQMEEISKKKEKFLGLVNNKSQLQKRMQNKEVRGESPIRKFSSSVNQSTLTSSKPSGTALSTMATTTAPTTATTQTTTLTSANNNSSSANRLVKAISQQNILVLNQSVSNLTTSSSYQNNNTQNNVSNSSSDAVKRPSSINRININHQSPRQMSALPMQPIHPFQQTYINSQAKQMQQFQQQQLTVSSAGSSSSSKENSTPQSGFVESWRAAEINEYEEMERLHSLKQRETLIKGMGVDEIVYKMLSGTNGTSAATIPAAAAAAVAAAAYLTNTAANVVYAADPHAQYRTIHLNEPVSDSNVAAAATGGVGLVRNNFSSKLELRTRNYNPFENDHSLLAEKFISSQQALKTGMTRSNKGSIGGIGGLNSNSINLNKIRAKLNNTTGNNANNITITTTMPHQISENSNLRYPTLNHQASIIDSSTASSHFQRDKVNSLNELSRKVKSTRYPVEMFTNSKQDASQQNQSVLHHANTISTINGYRIKSAQQLSKQKPSGLYIFSYHVPPE